MDRNRLRQSRHLLTHNKFKHTKPLIFASVVVICMVALAARVFWSRAEAEHRASKIPVSVQAVISSPTTTTPNLDNFISTTKKVINANPNITFEVSTIELSNNNLEELGGTSPMVAASVTKIITAADFLNQVEIGNESLQENFDGNTTQYEIQQMIVISDDEAWERLNNDLTYPQLQAYAGGLGISDYDAVNNTISATDIARVLADLYEGKLLNQSNTNLLLSYLKEANYRQYIVPAVPASDTVYHKIGLYNDNVNDAAIITHNKQAFVLVIFTNGNGSYNWPNRAELMQQIATAAISAYLGN